MVLFKEAELTFIGEDDDQKQPPVTIITGENGTGKTIILDAIRAVLIGPYGKIERDIIRKQTDFAIEIETAYRGEKEIIKTTTLDKERSFETNNRDLNIVFVGTPNPLEYLKDIRWVTDYWTSRLATDRRLKLKI